MDPTPTGPEPTSESGEYVWPAIQLELREEENSLVVDYESLLEKRLIAIPFLFFLMALLTFFLWLEGDLPLSVPGIWLGIGFGVAALFEPFHEYYRVDRYTGEIRKIKAYGKWEWGRPLGNLRDAVFFGFDGRYKIRRLASQFWVYRITLFFKDGTTAPLTSWEQKPHFTLQPHVAALEKALKLPYRPLQLEGERKDHPAPFTPETVFEYYGEKESYWREVRRMGLFLLKFATGTVLVAMAIAKALGVGW